MSDPPTVTACVIIIGNEILSGRTRDSNLAFLAAALNEEGVRVMEARVVADDRDAIIAAVNACRTAYDYVFTTGGIGPTHDDITSACIADAFGVRLERRPEAVRLLQQYAPGNLNEARLKMADVPEGADLLDNPVSRAPGFRLGNVFVLPGVPRIMQAMVDGIRPLLRGGQPMRSATIGAFLTESAVAAGLAAIQDAHDAVEIGSYPFVRDGRFGTSLVVRATDPAALDRAAASVRALVRSLGADPIEDAPAAPIGFPKTPA